MNIIRCGVVEVEVLQKTNIFLLKMKSKLGEVDATWLGRLD